MEKLKKGIALLTAGMLVVGLLSACSNSGNNAVNEPAATGGNNAVKEKVTLKVEMFDRGNAPAGAGPVTDNYWTKWIQENFGDPNNIEMEFVPVPRNQEVDKLNVLMSTGDAPDLVFTYDMNTIYNYVKDGGLAELDSIIDEHGQNLKTFLGDEVLEYGVFGGKQYTIPAKRTLQYTQSTYIRKDWLDKLGLPAPTTTEEFYNTMKAFKEQDPGQTGGKVIPYSFSAINGTTITSPGVLMSSFVEKLSDEDFYALSLANYIPEITKPGFKEGVRFLNKMYTENLINPDFALDKDGKQFESDVANGRVAAFTALAAHPTLMQSGNVFDTLQKNVPGAEYIAIDPFTDAEGKTSKGIYDPTGIHIMIPKTSKRAVEAIKYLDWMSQPDILNQLTNGIEGQHYTLENGFPRAITTDEAKQTFYNNVDIALVINGKDFGSQEKNIEATALAYPNYTELAKQTIMNGLKDGYTQPRFERPIEAEIKHAKMLKDKAEEAVVKSILSKQDQFDKEFDGHLAEYLKIGGQAVIDERRGAYQEMNQ
ncbi:ABC transporter substrate-binding protein [Paenibacillus sp. FSL H8-0548]|uniref:extracellular solute-binding protein n=1 Tax=Paenibacillus sp. FSL H8-0548 TaxID=1920422 RepID=UPI00096E645E|nr:extracellular solute-binding protein [Paenibacillus sp. FSL H8-0548]OMF32263.1 ABC transporter substrate-binding protein [Paenibacillus sp. FSL H8-0548]